MPKFTVLTPFCLGGHQDAKAGDVIELRNDAVTQGFVYSGRLAPFVEPAAPQAAPEAATPTTEANDDATGMPGAPPDPETVHHSDPQPTHRDPRARGQKEK